MAKMKKDVLKTRLTKRQVKIASEFAFSEDDTKLFFDSWQRIWITKKDRCWGFSSFDGMDKKRADALIKPVFKKILAKDKYNIITLKKGDKIIKRYKCVDNMDPLIGVTVSVKELDNFAGNYTVEINGKEVNMYILKIISRSGTTREIQHLYDCLRDGKDCFKIPIFGNKGSDIDFYDCMAFCDNLKMEY